MYIYIFSIYNFFKYIYKNKYIYIDTVYMIKTIKAFRETTAHPPSLSF